MGKDIKLSISLYMLFLGFALGLLEGIQAVYLRVAAGRPNGVLFPVADSGGVSLFSGTETIQSILILLILIFSSFLSTKKLILRPVVFFLLSGLRILGFYFYLYVKLEWGNMLDDYDLLMKFPFHLAAPVIANLAIGGAMFAAAFTYLYLAGSRAPKIPSLLHAFLISGGTICLLIPIFEISTESVSAPAAFAWEWFWPAWGGVVVVTTHFFFQYSREAKNRFF